MADALRKMLLAHAAKGYTSIEASAADMVSIYAGFQEELYRRLDRYVRTGNTGFTGRSAVALREEIEAMFPELTAAWYETAKYPVSYLTQSFYQQALTDLAAGKSTGVTSGVNTARIKLALESSYNDIAGATKAMSESAVRNLRDITARVNREANITGITRRQVSTRIYNELGGSSFIFSARDGSAWNGKAYTDMLGRTMLNNNARTAYLDGCAERGSDLVRISVSGNPCPKCAVWENRLLSISGTDPNYPSLQDATSAGLFHPNCTHRMVAVPAGTAKRRYNEDGRPLDGVNSPGKEERNDADAWKKYRSEQRLSSSATTPKNKKSEPVESNPKEKPTPETTPAPVPEQSTPPAPKTAEELHAEHAELRRQQLETAKANRLRRECDLAGAEPIRGEHTIEQDLISTNPNYSPRDPEYSKNCQRCVTAYEARRRGIDVEAKPRGSDRNEKIGLNLGWTTPYNNPKIINCSASPRAGGQAASRKIMSALEKMPNGARCGVQVVDETWGNAHVFIAERVDGKTVFYDPQPSGLMKQLDAIENIEKMSHEYAYVCRLDNLKFNSNISICAKGK